MEKHRIEAETLISTQNVDWSRSRNLPNLSFLI